MTDLSDKLVKLEEYYHYLESSFVDITKIIPLENVPKTFSPRLYEILQSACSQVDGVIKLMYGEYGSGKEKRLAAIMYKALNEDDAISCQTLAYKSRPAWKDIRPFLCSFECAFRDECDDPRKGWPRDECDDPHECRPLNKMPKWWNAYNATKHEMPDGYRAGSIENAYLALAGLYVLLAMMRHEPNPYSKSDFLRQSAWMRRIPATIGRGGRCFREHAAAEPSSEIFVSRLTLPQDDV